MKTIITFLIPFILGVTVSLAQAPDGFNYQAVARDNSGEVLADQNISVQISIRQGSAEGTSVYTETHEATTNSFGLFSLVIGQGISESGAFSAIEWGTDQYYIEIGIDPEGENNYVNMGSSRLLSVPYALYANQTQDNDDADADPSNELQNLRLIGDTLGIENGNKLLLPYDSSLWELSNDNIFYLSGNVGVGVKKTNSKLEVRADEGSTESDTLFAVKDKKGNIVFAVFPDGVKVYVDETAKGRVGGFAVSGRTATKAEEREYMRVTPDSTRIYFKPTAKGRVGGFAVSGRTATKREPMEKVLFANTDSTRFYINNSAKGRVGGFAVSGRTATKGILPDYFNVSASASVETLDPSRSQVLWYPKKEAFLAGRVLVESPDSIGTNSMATGFESKPIGNYSQALGYKARTFGDNSTAIGNFANAQGSNSFAFGDSARALSHASFAIGDKAISTGIGAYAIGSIGRDTATNAPTGKPALAKGDYSFAIGLGTRATERSAFAIGNNTIASGPFSMATGLFTEASGIFSTSMGFRTTAEGKAALAFGAGAKAIGDFSMAMGGVARKDDPTTVALGASSIAMGNGSKAVGAFSMAMGDSSIADGKYSMALGRKTYTKNTASLALGFNTSALQNFSTAMGNNTTASGYSSTSMGENTRASGDFSIAMGHGSIASGNASLAMGLNTEATNDYSFAIGSEAYATGKGSYAAGYQTTAAGAGTRAWGPYISVSGTNSLGISLGVKISNLTPTVVDVANPNVMAIMNGSVGIGTAKPTEKMQVVGNISVVNGSFLDDGTELVVPDYVFEPDYDLETIEEHARFMWSKKHLPALQSAKELKKGKTYNISERREQMLEELEKAHIYIERLNNRIKRLQQENQKKNKVIGHQDQRIKQLEKDMKEIRQMITQ